MGIQRGRNIFLALVAVLLFVSACGSAGGSSSSQTPLQVLQKSSTAMKQLKSAHIDMKFSGTLNTDATAVATPTTTSTFPHQVTISLTGNGDEVLPDKFSMHVTLGVSVANSPNTSLSEIILGRQLFIQSPKGQWYVIDASKLRGASGNVLGGINVSSYNSLLGVAQKGQIVDHGDQNLNGQSLRHISVTFGKDALRDLLNAATGTSSSQQSNDKLLNNLNVQQSTLDVWIDESTSYVHRLELKFAFSVNISTIASSITLSSSSNAGYPDATPTPSKSVKQYNLVTSVDTVIDYSKFNEAITITAPANAIPTSNPAVIFKP